jgi:hypothetical protein
MSAIINYLTGLSFIHIVGLIAIVVLLALGTVSVAVGLPILTGLVGLGIPVVTGAGAATKTSSTASTSTDPVA